MRRALFGLILIAAPSFSAIYNGGEQRYVAMVKDGAANLMGSQAFRSCSFYAPLDATHGLAAVGAGGNGGIQAPTYTRASIGTYVNPSTGLISQAASGVPRFEANGMLIEGSRTNNCPEILDSSWVDVNMTRTALSNSDISDFQTNKAAAVSATAAGGTSTHVFTLGSTQEEFYLYIKRITGSGGVSISTDTITWTPVTITGSWVRYGVTQTLANPTIGIKLATSGDVIGVWGVQLEAGAFATSYITTTSAAVTRAADHLSYGKLGNLPVSVPISVRCVEDSISGATASGGFFISTGTTGGTTNGLYINKISAQTGLRFRVAGSVNTNMDSASGQSVSGVMKSIALACNSGSSQAYINGTQIGTTATTDVPASHTAITIGEDNSAGGNVAWAHINGGMVFIRKLLNNEWAMLQ